MSLLKHWTESIQSKYFIYMYIKYELALVTFLLCLWNLISCFHYNLTLSSFKLFKTLSYLKICFSPFGEGERNDIISSL